MVLIFGRTIKETSRWLAEKSGKYVMSFLVLFGILLAVLFLASFVLKYEYNIYIVYIDLQKPISHVTNPMFLSVALDAIVISNGFKNFDMRNPKLVKLLRPLAPGYFRIGGNLADRLFFIPNETFSFKYDIGKIDGGDCAYSLYFCENVKKPSFTMSGREWLELNQLVSHAGFEIMFDLNVLTRFKNGSWNPSNAIELINFSDKHGLNLHWQLGNEPNAFPKQFETYMSPKQLAAAYVTLRKILNKHPRYQKSLLVGPEVTRPQENHEASIRFLQEFLPEAGHVLDAVTWHQYYFNGRFAKAYYYVNPKVFDILEWQISAVHNLTEFAGLKKSIWITETADAWGGGAEDLSDTFISTFLWIDKLGLAAKMGLDVVVRQSIVEGHYALIDEEYIPSPNWWLSVIYKMLVGPEVVPCYVAAPPEVRLYCQCANSHESAIIVFGSNLEDTSAKIRLQTHHGIVTQRVEAYILNSYVMMFSSRIRLNGALLKLTDDYDLPAIEPRIVPAKPHIMIPPYSVIFLKIPMANMNNHCKKGEML